MDYERSTDEDSDNEENWLDTNWDSVPCTSASSGPTNLEANQPNAIPGKGHNTDSETSGNGSFPLMARMQLNDHKAGMQGLDKEHINQIIYEASKGSKFFENERRKEEQVKLRIQEQKNYKKKLTETELQRGTVEADALIAQLETSRDLSQSIVHVDMDAFYAAVEMRDDPSLRDTPMAVGGMGMLSTSNYEARKYGVRAAMPGYIGCKLCPQLMIVPPNFAKYTEVSSQVREVFGKYDPNFAPVSLDEAYLNFTSHLTKRQSLSVHQRTYLKRCKTVVDPSACHCDLNTKLRDAVVFGKELPSVALQPELEGKNSTSESEMGDTIKESVVSSPRKLFRNLSKQADAGEKMESSLEFCITNEPPQCDSVEFRPIGIGSACHVCGKPIPEYQVVTFALDVESAVQEMRCRIEQRTQLTASAGIAPNRMLAKVCSDQNKPNGQFYLLPDLDTIKNFICTLPIRKISGVGHVTEQLLGALGIVTCEDLFKQRALLYHLYSSISFNYFMRIACGIGSVRVANDEERKSMSRERTFRELSRPEELYSKCLDLCNSLASDLAGEQLMGKTVTLKLKTTDFHVRTRDKTISNYINDAESIFAVAKEILCVEIQAELPKPLRLRLMGVKVSKLVPVSESPREKKDTITGFLSKAHSPAPAPGSPAHTHISFPDTRSPVVSVTSAISDTAADQGGSVERTSEDEEFVEKSRGHKVAVQNVDDNNVCGSEDGSDSRMCEDHDHTDQKNLQETCQRTDEGRKKFVVDAVIHVDRDSLVQNSQLHHTHTATGHRKKGSHLEADVNEEFDKDVHVSSDNGMQENQKMEISTNRITVKPEIHHSSNPDTDRESPKLPVLPITSSVGVSKTFSQNPASLGREANQSIVPAAQHCEDNSSNREHITTDVSSTDISSHDDLPAFCVREPSFTCPVCCKAVNCVNLTDFNAHIDRCLQGGPDQSQKQAADKLGKQQNPPATSSTKKSKKPQTASVKTPPAKKTSRTSVKKSQSSSSMSGSQQKAQSNKSENSKRLDVSCNANHTSQDQTVARDVLGSVDYLVCPLCGAGRADWTLETFNHHVDACLNRDTISQILREEKGKEKQRKKRQAGCSPEEQQSSSQQGGKKPKKPTPKPGCSILSFFKN